MGHLERRPQQSLQTSSWRKTDRYYTGSEDLDQNGTWTTVPDYGQVWVPHQDPNWAPYRDGRWVYQPYYGWTWVSYEPWGWAPYHYGRWMLYGAGWAWWPGPVYGIPATIRFGRQRMSPSLVSEAASDSESVSDSVSVRPVGWLPSGPGDWYHPWYGRYGGRYRAVNIRTATIFTMAGRRCEVEREDTRT